MIMFEDNINSRIRSLLDAHNRLNGELQDNIAQIYKKSYQIKKQTIKIAIRELFKYNEDVKLGEVLVGMVDQYYNIIDNQFNIKEKINK